MGGHHDRTTIGRVEGITVAQDGGLSVVYRNDGDLIVNLRNGTTLTGSYLGVLLVKLGMDDNPDLHGVELDAYPKLGFRGVAADAVENDGKPSPKPKPPPPTLAGDADLGLPYWDARQRGTRHARRAAAGAHSHSDNVSRPDREGPFPQSVVSDTMAGYPPDTPYPRSVPVRGSVGRCRLSLSGVVCLCATRAGSCACLSRSPASPRQRGSWPVTSTPLPRCRPSSTSDDRCEAV